MPHRGRQLGDANRVGAGFTHGDAPRPRDHPGEFDGTKPGPNREPTCAARRPVIFPVQPGGIWRIFLGLMAYLDLKGEGDKSMPGNQRPCRCVRAAR